jgi:hypothetical protein
MNHITDLGDGLCSVSSSNGLFGDGCRGRIELSAGAGSRRPAPKADTATKSTDAIKKHAAGLFGKELARVRREQPSDFPDALKRVQEFIRTHFHTPTVNIITKTK